MLLFLAAEKCKFTQTLNVGINSSTTENGWFQKISIPIPRAASRNSEGEGGKRRLEFRGHGGLRRLEFRGHGEGSLDWNSEGIRGFSGVTSSLV